MRTRSRTRFKTSGADWGRKLGLSVMPPGGPVKRVGALLVLIVQVVLICHQASTTATTTATTSVASLESAPREVAGETRTQPQDRSRDEFNNNSGTKQVRIGVESSSDGRDGASWRQAQANLTKSSGRKTAAAARSQPAPNCTIPEAGHKVLTRFRRTRSATPSDLGEFQVLAATNQRLVIPCRNSSSRSALRAGGNSTTSSWRRGPTVAPSRSGRPPSGGVALIVWHKDDQLNSPVFVADTRDGGSIREAKQRAISESLQGRARVDSMEVGVGSAAPVIVLIIEEARLEDAGLYTCTIEFDRAPTQMYQTSVVVLDPPKNMIIRDESPSQQDQPFPMPLNPAGPYDEGSQLVLTCEAQRGHPEAGQISWWQLESVNQIGPEMLNTAAAASRSPLVQPATAEAANYLTTLSLNNDRDLYLGRDSFQQHQVPFHQLVLQLLASSNHTSLLLMSGASRMSNARLRHWRRVDSSSKSSAGAGMASQQPIESGGGGGTLSSRLEIRQLTRANLANEFLCLASNSLVASPPLNSSLVLDLNLRPTEVRLVVKSADGPNFRLGQKTLIECHAIGSRPSPVIRWSLGSRQIDFDEPSQQVAERSASSGSTSRLSEFSRDLNNLTKVSYLTLTPAIEDNQLQLGCSAQNPKFRADDPGETQAVASDSLKMNVQFAPRLSLQLGAVIRPDSIRLGSDIFMDCLIEANPDDIQELVWLHDGQPLVANISAGIVITNNQSLVLRNIGVERRGAYECRARNSLGQSTSNRLELRPRHEPICDESKTRARYEIALNQPTRIECHVLAEPSEDLHFVWRFNRSDGGESQSPSDSLDHEDSLASGDSLENAVIKQQETNFTQSSVLFTATSRRHFGQLLCSADKQARPCSIQLVQSEVPEPVRGCFVEVHSVSSFSIHCQSSSSAGSAAVRQASLAKSGQQQQQQQPAGWSGAARYILELYQVEQLARNANTERAPPALDSTGPMRFRQAGGEQQPDYEDAEQSDQLDLVELQTVQQQRQRRVKRLESELPSFSVTDLKPNATYNIVIYVQNQKGRSQATHHQVSLSQAPGGARSAASSDHGDQPSARPEFLGKRSSWPNAPANSSRLLSFLRIDDLLSGGRNQSQSTSLPPPVIAVALIVLLSTTSLVLIVFFVNKLICSTNRSSPTTTTTTTTSSSSGSSSNRNRRKSPNGGGSSVSPTQDEDEGDDEEEQQSQERFVTRHRRSYASARTAPAPLSAMNERLAKLRPPDRCQAALVGSGSDTSRETNTDSTLISSPASKMTNSKQTDSTPTSSNWTAATNQLATTATKHKRCSHGDLSQLSACNLIDNQRQCSGTSETASLAQYQSSTLRIGRRDLSRLNMIARPASGLDEQLMLMSLQQQQAGLYGTHQRAVSSTRCRNSASSQSRATQQVSSIHSSECSSNNVDNSLELMPHSDCHNSPNLSPPSQFQHQQLVHHYNYLLAPGQTRADPVDHFDVGQLTGLADSGVYVISDGSSEHHRLDFNGEPAPGGVQNPTVIAGWCSRGVQNSQYQALPDQHKRCHLINATSNSLQLEQQQQQQYQQQQQQQHRDATTIMMPNSFSIPVALMDGVQDDRPSSMSSNFRTRRLSSDNLTLGHNNLIGQDEAACWPVEAPSETQHSTSIGSQFPDRGHQQPMPPADFANDYQCYQKTISVPCPGRLKSDEAHSTPPVAQKQQKSITSHRVKFDTSNMN